MPSRASPAPQVGVTGLPCRAQDMGVGVGSGPATRPGADQSEGADGEGKARATERWRAEWEQEAGATGKGSRIDKGD